MQYGPARWTVSLAILATLVLTGCKTVVTTTTEIRPARYAVLEFERPVSHDNMVTFAQRALTDETVRIQSVDAEKAVVVGGPVRIAAMDSLPALEATVTISGETRGANTRIRIFATAVLEQNGTGGVDARLMELAQRLEKRLDVLIGH